jgi:5-methylthioadenosine/S-adenosylhomocysteine deaminase
MSETGDPRSDEARERFTYFSNEYAQALQAYKAIEDQSATLQLLGVADDLRLMDWLTKYIFPAEAKNVSAPFVRTATKLAALEMIRSGTTTFVDMYYFEDQIAEAAKEAGIRGVLGSTVIEVPGGAPDAKTVPDALANAERFLKRWAGDPLVVPALAPHSAYLCSPETLKSVKALADRYNAPILIHLSEVGDEVKTIKERYGKTSTEHLRDLGFLRKGVLGAHGVWLTESDRAILKAADVGIAHCPQSNMKLSSGAAPVKAMLAEGMRLGLGTDGAASNNDLDMFEAMRMAAFLHKLQSADPQVIPAATALEMATIDGAKALGLESKIGSLETGKKADLVVVSMSSARQTPLYDPVSHLVYASRGDDVRTVVVNGKVYVGTFSNKVVQYDL